MEASDIEAQILAQVQKIKDEQKQKLNEEEEKKKQAYIQQQAEIIINSEKYEALSEDEKKQMVYQSYFENRRSIEYISQTLHLTKKQVYNIIYQIKQKIKKMND
jgi:DNA-directed RNA polymerase specialized sigma subunit